jgi:uncharacterized protein (TIGR02246 family)
MTDTARDEAAIRQLVATWMKASQAGDVDTVLSLMADDVVFLVADQPPMRKADFEKAARAQAGAGAPQIDGEAKVQEVQVMGDCAFAWTELRVTVTPRDGGAAKVRAGHTLTVFRREHGRWVLARDANLLVPVPSA